MVSTSPVAAHQLAAGAFLGETPTHGFDKPWVSPKARLFWGVLWGSIAGLLEQTSQWRPSHNEREGRGHATAGNLGK